MISRYLAALALIASPALADQRLFDRISAGDSVRIVLPGGHCEAELLGRGRDELNLKLTRTAKACGERGTMVSITRVDTWDVSVKEARQVRGPAARLAAKSAAVVAVMSAINLSVTRSRTRALARMGGAALVTAALSSRRSGYIVAAERISPQP